MLETFFELWPKGSRPGQGLGLIGGGGQRRQGSSEVVESRAALRTIPKMSSNQKAILDLQVTRVVVKPALLTGQEREQ